MVSAGSTNRGSSMDTTFPSAADLKRLRLAMKMASGSLDDFGEEDRWRFHAYDYAWQKFYRQTEAATSPLDRDGDWFNEGLRNEAIAIFPIGKRSYVDMMK